MSTATKFHVKGPMGKGLNLKQTGGTHIALTGGTGVLPFLDLVAYMIRYNLGLIDNLQSTSFIENPTFKFVLYVSHASFSEAIGRDLCKGLSSICEKLES